VFWRIERGASFCRKFLAMTLRSILAFSLGIVLACPAIAQDQIGTVTGTVDGQPSSWTLSAGEGHESPGVWINMGPGMDLVTIFAKSDAAAESGMLNLTFGMMRNAGATIIFRAEGYFRGGEPVSAYSAPMDEGIVYTLTMVEEVEGGLHVQGDFSGDFFLASATGEIDKSQSIAIAGTFDTIVPPN